LAPLLPIIDLTFFTIISVKPILKVGLCPDNPSGLIFRYVQILAIIQLYANHVQLQRLFISLQDYCVLL